MSRDLIMTIVFRLQDVPEGVAARQVADYLAHLVEDREGTPAPEICEIMRAITGTVLGHHAREAGKEAQEPHGSRLSVKGPGADMRNFLARCLEACELAGGDVFPARPAMLKRSTFPVRLLLALAEAGVSLPWLLSGEGQPLHRSRVLEIEAQVRQGLCALESLDAAVAEGMSMARMTAEDLAERKSDTLSRLKEAEETIRELRARLRDADAELAASRFSM